MTKTPKIFFSEDWFGDFLEHIQSCVKNVHGCIVSTSAFDNDTFPQIIVHRKETTCSFSDTVRMHLAFVIRTDYRGQKQEIDLMHSIKKGVQGPIDLKTACVVLLYKGEEQKISEKRVRQASLFYQMTVRFKEDYLIQREEDL